MVSNAFGNGAAWNPWQDLSDLRSQVDRFLGATIARSNGSEFPPIEIWRSDEGIRVWARVPGFTADSLELTVVGDTLTLKGNRREPEAGSFARAIRLPFAVDGDAAKARFEDGILEVDLPRSASDKPRKIIVNNA